MAYKIQLKSFTIAFVVFTSLLSIPVIAEELSTPAVPEKTRSPWEERLINYNIIASKFIDNIAENIDEFLVGKKVSKRVNETNVRIINVSSSSEGQYVENLTHLNVNLRLPNVEDYFQLKFTTYNQNEERGTSKRYGQPPIRKQNYGATVGLFKNLGSIRTSFQPRIELQDPLKVSHSLSFDTSAKMTNYEFKPKLEFFADPDKGTGIFAAVNYAFFLNNIFTLNWINEGEYEEKKKKFSSAIGFSLIEEVTEKSTLAYSLFAYSNSRPAYHLQSYNFSVAWNQLLYKKILDYQIIPSLSFSDPYFKGTAGISLVLNLNF